MTIREPGPPPEALPIGDCTRCAEPVLRPRPGGPLIGAVLNTPNCAGLGVGRLSGDDRRSTLPHTLDTQQGAGPVHVDPVHPVST